MRELYNDNEFYLKKKYGSELNYKLWLFGGFTRLLVENLFITFKLVSKHFVRNNINEICSSIVYCSFFHTSLSLTTIFYTYS